jgi:hypothetical protein
MLLLALGSGSPRPLQVEPARHATAPRWTRSANIGQLNTRHPDSDTNI